MMDGQKVFIEEIVGGEPLILRTREERRLVEVCKVPTFPSNRMHQVRNSSLDIG